MSPRSQIQYAKIGVISIAHIFNDLYSNFTTNYTSILYICVPHIFSETNKQKQCQILKLFIPLRMKHLCLLLIHYYQLFKHSQNQQEFQLKQEIFL